VNYPVFTLPDLSRFLLNMKCTNIPELNRTVRRQYRAGWTL